MKHISTIPICSNTLFIYKLDIQEDLNLKFKKEEFLPRNLNFKAGKGVDMNILNKYKNLTEQITAAVDETLEKILMLENVNYKIFTSWLTKTAPGDFSDSHRHSNSWLSGVYYPKGDPGFSIKFHHDNKTQFFTMPKEYNIYNSTEWIVYPEDNNLILFFSQLRHEILRNESNKDRYSLAFNVLPQGKFGVEDSYNIF
jgi:uncharacterized protein (TIGR02466 family)|tara:strand:+ start:3918 stop:4511 length:594 start_codon:yes stop_codon:yes gene_type:complete